MYSHDGTWDFLKLVAVLGFIVLAVWWLQSNIGFDYTLLIILALAGVGIFLGGQALALAIQKNTLNAITRFNADDAKIDQYRQQSFKAMAQGESAMQRAAAQLTVLDAKRVTQIANQRAKLLTDTERAKWEVQQGQQADVWTWDDGDSQDFQQWG